MTVYTVKIHKAGTTRAVDWDALPETSKAFIINYGLTQKFNDSIASVDKDATSAINDTIGEVMDRLIEGTLEIRDSGPRGDPVRKRALQMAYDYLANAKLKAKPRAEKAKAMVDSGGKWLEMAQEAIDEDAARIARMVESETDDLVPAEEIAA